MTDEEFNSWVYKHKIPAHAVNIIRQVRENEPFRRVQGGKSNVAGRYPSRKMGCIIQFESHQVEFPFAVDFENDEEIIEFYDQPVSVKLTYKNIKGRHLGIISRPDYFLIQSNGTAGWVECKTEEELIRLSEKAPNRYCKDEKGCWRSPPGEEYASQYDLFFKIMSSAEINWFFFRNLIFLQDYQREESMVAPEIQAYITTIVESNQGISLLDLLLDQTKYTANDVYRTILNDGIYVDLHRYPLGEPERAPVFSSEYKSLAHAQPQRTQKYLSLPTQIIIEPGTGVIWAGNPFTIMTVGEGFVWLQNEHCSICKLPISDFESLIDNGEVTGVPLNTMIENNVLALLKKMSGDDHKRALSRRDEIARFLSGDEKLTPDRSEYRWIKKYKEAEALFGIGFIGLYDKNSNKGNKKPRLHKDSYDLMDLFIETEHLTLEDSSVKTAYGQYVKACGEAGISKISYETFRKRIKAIDAELRAGKRKGKRSAYQLKPFYTALTYTTSRHGERPFEIAHIDHTELDIELINPRTLENLGRPWLTLMADAYSRRILAFYLSFEPPSYRSCMNVMRICGLRHKCLPQIIVVDNGKEFKSTYFELLLASKEITKKERPPAQSRFGSLIERLFNTTNSAFIHTLQGNTQIMKEVREVTKSNNPKNRAVWNFSILTDKLAEYLYEVYDSMHHTGIRESPRDAFNRGLFLFGKRRIITPSAIQGFVFSTMPTTDSGEATVIQSQGVKINNIYYRHAALNTPGVVGSKVQVKYDPFNLGHAYAYIGNNWTECMSEYYAQFKDLTEKELQVISVQLAAEYAQNHSKTIVSAQKIAAFIAATKGTEKELIQQKLAEEQRGKFSFKENVSNPVKSESAMAIADFDWNNDDKTESDDEYRILS
ncbi:MAG: DDE-type integrase/transposase/recombinase [Desulfuromonadaceae bacterium]|nr:DDE-type integrase/transposase/recombinase [Desulfuromonadaceae bacterium]MDD2848490.1 DDE-type integrase/transposase/recombinase [Desulfuromonadaceae bacterium]MDD4129881.1 DDE-type integrase/transposase/recombinase [Desulfuromonadaceae bacterium]